MSVGSRVDSAIDALEKADAEGALLQISSAIDATAAVEYTQRGGAAYKRFLGENMALITRVGLGVAIGDFNIKLNHPDLKLNAQGLVGLESILYHVMRCCLVHEASLPPNIEFGEEQVLSLDKNHLILPRDLIYGLVFAVVVAPSNHDQRLSQTRIANIGNAGTGILQVHMNCLWGRRKEFLWLLDSIEKSTMSMVSQTELDATDRIREDP